MTVKTLLPVLLLTVVGLGTPAQVAPPPTGGSNAPSYDEVMRRALRETGSDDTNAVVAQVAPRTNLTPARSINRPPLRPRPTLPDAPAPGNVTPAAAAPSTPSPAVPAAQPQPNPTPAPTPAPAPPAATESRPAPGDMTMTPHVSSAATIPNADEIVPANSIDFTAATLEQVLEIYGQYVGRNILRPATLPDAKIVLKQTTPLTKLEVVQAIEAAMALNNVSVVNVGEKFVTVVPTADAWKIPGIINTNAPTHLADLGSVMTHIVQLKYTKPSEMVQVLTPFASGTAPNPILPVDSSGILVLRDNVANVKRMLEMIEKVDVTAPSEFISEVIPIKFAKAEDIASALSSIGGGGGGGTTVGSRPTGSTGARTSGFSRQQGGLGYNQPGMTPNANLSGATARPTPTTGSTFSQNLQNIIRKAASSGDLEILGTTKIIADVRSNSLLIFASREDMKEIKDIISKLDVVLAQVLIETLIMDVTIGDSWNLNVSAAQATKQFNQNFAGAGGMNANTFFDFAGSSSTNALGQLLGSGIKYFGKVNDDIYVSVAAAAAKGKVKVVQRPRIQTSHATPASLFIGSTVPYVTSTYYGGGYNGGPSSSYQQLRVGIGLDVTPFINADGLVVMQIQETIDELDGSTEIQGVGAVPNTKSSSLSAEIAVRDGESVILGGIVRNSDDQSNSGVPILKDIPLLGYLFRSTTSNKKRQESIVLMRPTVLRTPELAALQVNIERQHMPAISEAESSIRRENQRAEAAEARRLRKEAEEDARAAAKYRQSPAYQTNVFNEVVPFTPEERRLYNPPETQP